MDDN
jgi:hypothetical protein